MAVVALQIAYLRKLLRRLFELLLCALGINKQHVGIHGFIIAYPCYINAYGRKAAAGLKKSADMVGHYRNKCSFRSLYLRLVLSKEFSLLNILPRSRCFFKHHGVKNDYYLASLRNALLCRKMRKSVLCKEEDTKNCRDGKEKSSLSSEDFVVAAVGFEPTTNRV